ncbi:MAG: thiamine phosphate synthase, partial [Planctomycetota bacterium]|nr:thiamine phosphate synthase [Planctomycetota bacterium]
KVAGQGTGHAALLAARDAEGDLGPAAYRGFDVGVRGGAGGAFGVTTWKQRRGLDPFCTLALFNLKRAQESLRSLEECAKLVRPGLSRKFEGLRFALYGVEQRLAFAVFPRDLRDARGLYVLVTGTPGGRDGLRIITEVLAGGAKWIQLREKRMADRALLDYAVKARRLTREQGARLIINDRVDIALLCGADGVHLGGDDVSVRAARRLAGGSLIIGATSHSPVEALARAAEGADYVSVGPVFASVTKPGLEPRGLAFVRHVARSFKLPFVAIGGINRGNVKSVARAGARWFAVSAAILTARDVRSATRRLVEIVGS